MQYTFSTACGRIWNPTLQLPILHKNKSRQNIHRPNQFNIKENARTIALTLLMWSGLRGSNSLPPPWQGGALPDELNPHKCYVNTIALTKHLFVFVVLPDGIEPSTRGFSVPCSTDWATEAFIKTKMATRKRLELSTSAVTGRRSNQLNYRAVWWEQ